MKVTIEIPDADVWDAVFNAGWNLQYSWWVGVEYVSPLCYIVKGFDPNGDEDDPDAPVVSRVVTPSVIADVITKHSDRTYWGYYLWDFENYDAAVADSLMQLIVFGDEVYA